MEGQIGRQMMDGWVHRWMGRRMDKWIDRRIMGG